VLHHIPIKELWIDVLSWVQYAKVLFCLVDIVEQAALTIRCQLVAKSVWDQSTPNSSYVTVVLIS
jgi:hypothetical protein